jgi:hypothetical protein
MSDPLVVVNEFNDHGEAVAIGLEGHDQPELVVQTHRVLSCSITLQLFQSKSAQRVEVTLVFRGVDELDLLPVRLDDIVTPSVRYMIRVLGQPTQLHVAVLDSQPVLAPSPLG